MRVVMLASQRRDVRARRLARYLTSRGHTVIHVAGWEAYDEPCVLQRVEDLDPGCETYVHRTDLGPLLRSSIVEGLRPDVVWCHALAAAWRYTAADRYTAEVERQILAGDPMPPGWRANRGPVPIVYDAHEYERDRPWRWSRPRMARTWAEQEARVLEVVDHAVTVSDELVCALGGRVWPLPTTIDTITNAPPALSRPLRTREARALLPPGRLIAFAGYPTPDRDLETLCRALPLVQQVAPDVRLVLFGAAKDRSIVDLVQWAGGVLFGEVPYPWPEEQGLHLLDFLSACNVGFSGAWTEFLTWRLSAPNKLYEYACADLPQVSAEILPFQRLNATTYLGRTYNGSALDLAEQIVRTLDRPERAQYPFRERESYSVKNGPTIDRVLEGLAGPS